MQKFNDVNMRRIVYFLCKNEGIFYYPRQINEEMNLDIDDAKLREELYILHKYDIIELERGRYGGVFDRTLKKVLMINFGDILGLEMDDFKAYFVTDNYLDYLKERIKDLEINRRQRSELEDKLASLKGLHNNTKGNMYELEVLVGLIRMIVDDKKGPVQGMNINDFLFYQRYHLPSGEKFDIYLESGEIVLLAECKNYEDKYIYKINNKMIDDFTDKISLAKETLPEKEIRPAFFSNNGFETEIEEYLKEKDIYYG